MAHDTLQDCIYNHTVYIYRFQGICGSFAALASRLVGLLGERTPNRGQDTIGSIMVEDPNISPPGDAVLCRKNVTAIWQLAAGIEAGHKPAIRMSPAEIEAFGVRTCSWLAGAHSGPPPSRCSRRGATHSPLPAAALDVICYRSCKSSTNAALRTCGRWHDVSRRRPALTM